MTIYRDYAGVDFHSLEELARHRIKVQAPLFGDTICPAAEYTYAVSPDEGRTWHNPDAATKLELALAVARQEGCCLNLGDGCHAKIGARERSEG